jgi:hypothetical protein
MKIIIYLKRIFEQIDFLLNDLFRDFKRMIIRLNNQFEELGGAILSN